jgi:hypothetical protein
LDLFEALVDHVDGFAQLLLIDLAQILIDLRPEKAQN